MVAAMEAHGPSSIRLHFSTWESASQGTLPLAEQEGLLDSRPAFGNTSRGGIHVAVEQHKTMARLYSVTMQSPTAPIAFTIVTLPAMAIQSDAPNSPRESLQALGINIDDEFSAQDNAATRLAALAALVLWKQRSRVAHIEQVYESSETAFQDFSDWVAQQEFVPVEASPLHGTSLDSLMKKGSLMGFGTFTEGYGLIHHDPVICIVALPMIIIIGATVGAGEATQERVKQLLGATRRKKRHD